MRVLYVCVCVYISHLIKPALTQQKGQEMEDVTTANKDIWELRERVNGERRI
jgi:hypothetical protein